MINITTNGSLGDNIDLKGVIIIRRNWPKLVWTSALLLLGIILNLIGTYWIGRFVPDRPIPPDLLFTYTPYLGWTQYLSDLANVLSVGLLAGYVFSRRQQILPVILLAFGLAEWLRGLIILLNPLGSPLGPDMRYGVANLLPIEQLGQFPSGHTMVVVMCYLLIERQSAPNLKVLALLSVVIEVVSLILSRGHYAIDIVGGFLIAYFAYTEVSKRASRLKLA